MATDKPVAYMRQLCKHFGHKVDASFGDGSGYIQFEFGRCDLHANDGALMLDVCAADADSHEPRWRPTSRWRTPAATSGWSE